MKVIAFSVTDEVAAEAREYARRKGYGRVATLARVALVQLMSRYPTAGRGGQDRKTDGAPGEVQRGVLPVQTAGGIGGGAA